VFCLQNWQKVRVLSGAATNNRAESKAYKKQKKDCETLQSRQYRACAFFQRHRNGFWSTALIGESFKTISFHFLKLQKRACV
jgi:hypothetical protein